jgi:hypothetical protein
LQNKEEKTKNKNKKKKCGECWKLKLESCGTSRNCFDKKDGERGERGVARLERNGNVN